MYKQCTTEQSAARQRALEQGLLEAMMQRHYDEITVSDLCDHLNIPRKSFYRYFSSKEGALHALIDHALLDFEYFAVEKSTDSSHSLEQIMERLFAYWKYQKPLLDALARSGLSGAMIQRAIGHTILEYNGSSKFLPLQDRFAKEYTTLFVVCGLMSLMIQWHHQGYPQSVQQMARIAVRLVTQPLAGSPENME